MPTVFNTNRYICLYLLVNIILSALNHIDTQLFLFLNGIHSPFFDPIFQWITERFSWIPLYVLLSILLFIKFKWRSIFLAPFIVLVIVLADQISVNLFKEVFLRLRPCHNPAIADLVHTIDGACGGQYGFVSSHAANTFALAFLVGLIFKKHFSSLIYLMLFWAALVSYSRIYVGVHYPADIICGALLGVFISWAIWKLLQFSNQYFNLKLNI